jgi:predicted nucleotidyltransferase
VDVGVLLDRASYPTRQARFAERLRLTSRLGGHLGNYLVDVVILNDAPPTLARRIVTTGERVFCANPDADHDFVRDAQLRAADLEPFLARTRRIKLAALAR